MFHEYQLPRSSPEEQNVSSFGIHSFIKEIEELSSDRAELELHSFMMLRHGAVIAEAWWKPYEENLPNMVYSLSKSFTSTAIGLAIEEGIISLDDPVICFFPEEVPQKIGKNLAAMNIRHLLSMSTGHAEDTEKCLRESKEKNWVKVFFSIPVEHQPGSRFVYNTGASYMLSAIIQKITGKTLFEYLKPHIFKPLNIEGASWDTCPKGISAGGYGLYVSTEDIAKFGQLYLQKGIWRGKRILSRKWVEQASSCQISTSSDTNPDWKQGYGYQFWLCRHNAYRADGAFGQFCIIMPEYNAVIAITSASEDSQIILDLVWKHLIPAMNGSVVKDNDEFQISLRKTLSSLRFSLPEGKKDVDMAAKINGKKYVFDSGSIFINNSALILANIFKSSCIHIYFVSFEFNDKYCFLTFTDDSGKYSIECGIGEWLVSRIIITKKTFLIAAGGIWTEDNSFICDIRFIETPFKITIKSCFVDDKLILTPSINVSYEKKHKQQIIGQVKS